jgi:hypothetical protein
MDTYDTHLLHKWLLKTTSDGSEYHDPDALVRMQVNHIKELAELQGNPHAVKFDLLRAAIELTHIQYGPDGLTMMADHLRGSGDALDIRVRRGGLKLVSGYGKPSNED